MTEPATDPALKRSSPPPSGAGERILVGLLAAAAASLALLVSWFALDLIPHVTDAVAYLFQGRILASGHLFLPPPPVAPLFGHENIILEANRWCSPYPPGWPLLLALGWLVHAPWLMSPLLLALAVVGAWLAGRRFYDPLTGVAAAAALACSPFALLMAGDAMAHVAALCGCLWCMALLGAAVYPPELGVDEQRWRLRCVAAGFVGAFALLIRPLTAVAILAPLVGWCGVRLARRGRIVGVAWMGLGALPPLAFLAYYDATLFGSPFSLGYSVTNAQYAHGALVAPATALLHTLPWYLDHLNQSLWGLPCGDLLLLLPLLFARPRRSIDAVLAASAGALLLAQSFYYYGDIIYSGPRLVFETLAPLSLLAARSLLTLRGWLYAGVAASRHRASARWMLFSFADGRAPWDLLAGVRRAAVLVGLAALLYFPLGRRLPAQTVHEAQWYLAVSASPLQEAVIAGVGANALIFVAGTPWCYTAFFPANAIDPQHAERVYVRDIAPLRAAALQAYPRREVWVARVDVTIPDPVHDPDVARPTRLTWQRLR